MSADEGPIELSYEWARLRGGVDEKLATIVTNMCELVHAARETQLREVSRAATATQVKLTLDAAKEHQERVA